MNATSQERHMRYVQQTKRISRLLDGTQLPVAFDRQYYRELGAVEIYTAEQVKAYAKAVLQAADQLEQ